MVHQSRIINIIHSGHDITRGAKGAGAPRHATTCRAMRFSLGFRVTLLGCRSLGRAFEYEDLAGKPRPLRDGLHELTIEAASQHDVLGSDQLEALQSDFGRLRDGVIRTSPRIEIPGSEIR